MSDHYDEHGENREHLNRVRPRGKGANGGVGSRRRRHPNKVFTRKLSEQEQQRAEDVVRAVIKTCALTLTDAERGETSKMLCRDFQLDGAEEREPHLLWKAVKASPNRLLVVNANKRYLKAIIYAYGLYETVVSAADWHFNMHIHELSELSGIRLTPGFSLLRAILRVAIDYEEDNPESDHHGKWSRDALAIQWLMSQGVRADRVEAYQKENGGGVDEWSRLAARPARGALKKQEVEVLASRMEGDAIKREEANAPTESAEDLDSVFRWGEADLGDLRSRERVALQKLCGGGPWLSEMLLYYSREKGIGPVEGMISLVVGDPDSPLGVRHVNTLSVGDVTSDDARLVRGFRLLANRLSVVLTRGERYTWNEAAWRHDRYNARAEAERRRASWQPRGRPYRSKL
jgi:hypothetical protein